MSLKLRRGVEADRSGVTFGAGEPAFVTDTKKLYIGDGSTAGGVQVGSGGPLSLASKTGAYTLTTDDDVVLGDATSGGITLTLPTATGATGKAYHIKKIDSSSNTVTIATTSSQTIDGSASAVIYLENLTLTVVSDGSNWRII